MKFDQDFIISVVDNGFVIKIGSYRPDYVECKTYISKDHEEIKKLLEEWFKGVERK
jgi:hypothetical protein